MQALRLTSLFVRRRARDTERTLVLLKTVRCACPRSTRNHVPCPSTSVGSKLCIRRSFASSSYSSSSSSDKGESSEIQIPPPSLLSDDWIPPSRPLAGDSAADHESPGMRDDDATARAQVDEALFYIDEDDDTEEDIQRKLDEALRLEDELEQRDFQRALAWEEQQQLEQQLEQQSATSPVDWLTTRRKTLASPNNAARSPVVPVRVHELLTRDELTTFLESHEAVDVHVVLDRPHIRRMGGAEGMIFCGAMSSFHLQTMTKVLIDHLKARRLQERGVLGAQMNSNQFSSSRNNGSSNLHQHHQHHQQQPNGWNVVDCQNYIVHLMDEPTRNALRLEELWSGKDPLWSLDIRNEEAMDQYVAQNPVPADYGYPHSSQLKSPWDSIGKLERNQFAPHTPLVSSLQKQKDRREGRRKRRERRQGYSY